MNHLLSAAGITKQYEKVQVLKGIDFHIDRGELVSIVGPSGAGKSTLLHILGTLDPADSGEIFMNGQALHQLKGKALSEYRNRHMGFIFQFHHLLPEFTTLENICIPAWIAGQKSAAVTARARELMQALGILHLADQKPGQMSGGEQQRAAVARALINRPDIVFADEPTGNLDSRNAREMHDLFLKLRDTYGQTFLIVTHNEELAGLCDRIVSMQDGRLKSA